MSIESVDNDETELNQAPGNFVSYIWGFLLSLVLTVTAYFLVEERVFAPHILISLIVSLGIIQMFIQLIFFLHLGHESKPRWNLLAFLFMTLVVVILVVGSLWIMSNLDERVMPVETRLQYQK